MGVFSLWRDRMRRTKTILGEKVREVLASQVPGIPNAILVGAVAVGVGAFLVGALAMLFPASGAYIPADMPQAADSRELGGLFLAAFPVYAWEVMKSLFPIAAFFPLFQIAILRLKCLSSRRSPRSMC